MGVGARASLVKGGGAVSGLETATEILGFLQALGSKVDGLVLKAKRREDGVGNDVIMDYLDATLDDNGVPYTIGQRKEDADKAAKLFLATVEKALRMMSKRGKPLKRWSKAKRAKFIAAGGRRATNIAARGLRKAGRSVQADMARRLEAGINVRGQKVGPVTNNYANWRLREYGVPKNVVYKATGQLLDNVLNGSLTLIKRETWRRMMRCHIRDLGKDIKRGIKGSMGAIGKALYPIRVGLASRTTA